MVPAAIGGVITGENADSLRCRYLVEAANGPTTPEGDQALRKRGIVVLPDIYTNGGPHLRLGSIQGVSFLSRGLCSGPG